MLTTILLILAAILVILGTCVALGFVWEHCGIFGWLWFSDAILKGAGELLGVILVALLGRE